MIDTPIADAAAQTCMDTTSEWHGEWVPLEVARQLESKLAKAKHQIEVVTRAVKNAAGVEDGRDALEEVSQMKHHIRRLIEERDRARIQADHKWKLREEFEALLGTSDLAIGVERVKEAQLGAARYEYVRKLNPREFSALTLFCNTSGIHFDAEVDRRRSTT